MNKGAQKLFNIILAFLVAIGGWLFVVYNYYPMTDVDYTDVPISFVGERALADRGLAVSSAESNTISATLNQKRVDVNVFSSEDIIALADLSDCVAGDNRVGINVNGPSGTNVIKSGPSTVSVNVERTESAFMDIDVVYSAGAPDNAEPIALDMGQEQAEVVCAASKMKDVKSIAAVLNYSEVSDKIKSYTAKLVALDSKGEQVPHTVIYPEEISLDASAGVTKTVSLKADVNSKVNDNYERKYTVPDAIVIKGTQSAINQVTSVSTKEIDIRYIYENTQLPIEFDLPEGIYVSHKSDNAVIKVVVTKKANDDAGGGDE